MSELSQTIREVTPIGTELEFSDSWYSTIGFDCRSFNNSEVRHKRFVTDSFYNFYFSIDENTSKLIDLKIPVFLILILICFLGWKN